MSTQGCQHEWSEHYVCTLCKAIKYGSAPLWAHEAPIACGPGRIWIALWTCADRDTTAPDPVYPGNELLQRRAGGLKSARSVQRSLDALALAGWIRIKERGGRRYIWLAWGKRRLDWAAAAKAEQTAHGDGPVAVGDETVASGDGPVASSTTTILSQEATILSQEATILSHTGDGIVARTLDDLGTTLDDLEPRGPSERDPERDPERAVIAMLIELNVAGSNPGPSFVAPMLERMRLDGCTLGEVRKIVVEWKRRKDSGDKGLCRLQSLFYAGSWWKTRTEYLGERPSPPASRARASTPSISSAWDEYEANEGAT